MPDNEREDTIGLVDDIDDFEAELRQMMSRRLSDRPGPLIVLTPGHTVAGKYRLKERLGSGGMGVIWQAAQVEGGPDVALKIMRQEMHHQPIARKRFQLEALNAAALDHPNVVGVVDHGNDGDMLFLAMEYVQGQALDERVAAGPSPWRTAAHIGLQVLEALIHAHEHPQRIIHRDIKPSNILLTGDDRANPTAKVLDFGIARALEGDGAGTMGPIGSPHYMAPELWQQNPVGPAVDLYALGCTLHEVCAGKPPFDATIRALLGMKHINQPPPPLPNHVPAPLAHWLETLMAKSPQDRPASARDAVKSLRLILAMPDLDAAVSPVQTFETPPPPVIAGVAGSTTWHTPPTTDVPPPRGAFVGRAQTLEALQEGILNEAVRVIYLEGPAGSGRARVAMEGGLRLGERLAGGQWRCDLSWVTHEEALFEALGHTLGVPLLDADPAQQLAGALKHLGPTLVTFGGVQRPLVWLHRWLEHWSQCCPAATFVVIGKAPEPVPDGALRLRLEPLELPAQAPADLKPETLQAQPALSFFADQLDAALEAFTEIQTRALFDVIQHSGGMPLALRMLATRASRYTPERIATELPRHAQDAPDALTGTLRWMWSSLRSRERVALIQCTTFAGRFSAQSARAIIDLGPFKARHRVDDLLASLHTKGLLKDAGKRHGSQSYRLHPVTAAFARQKLQTPGALKPKNGQPLCGPGIAQALARRHAEHFAARLTPAPLPDVDTRADLGRALQWALQAGDADLALGLTLKLCTLLQHRGPHKGALRILASVIGTLKPTPIQRARLLLAMGQIQHTAQNPQAATAAFKHALDAAQRHNHPKLQTRALLGLAQTDRAQAKTHLEKALELALELEDAPKVRAQALAALCALAPHTADDATLQQALQASQSSQSPQASQDIHLAMAKRALAQRHGSQAAHHVERALKAARAQGTDANGLRLLHRLAPTILQHGYLELAYEHLTSTTPQVDSLGSQATAWTHHSLLSQTALLLGHHAAALAHATRAHDNAVTALAQTQATLQRAAALVDAHKPQQARQALHQALHGPDPSDEHRLNIILLEMRLELDSHTPSSAATLLPTLQHLTTLPQPPSLCAAALQIQTRLALDLGQHDQAQTLALQAQQAWQPLHNPYETAICQCLHALACFSANPRQAAQTLQAATQRAQHIHTEPQARLARWLRTAKQVQQATQVE